MMVYYLRILSVCCLVFMTFFSLIAPELPRNSGVSTAIVVFLVMVIYGLLMGHIVVSSATFMRQKGEKRRAYLRRWFRSGACFESMMLNVSVAVCLATGLMQT